MTKVNCDSCVSPRSRDSLIRLKSESPKFRDAMRKKCQQRWRENRWRFMDKNRVILENPDCEIQDALKSIIKDDLRSLMLHSHSIDSEIEAEEEYENNLQDEEFKWFFQEYDKILEDDDNLAKLFEELESDGVFCPICEKSYLSIEKGDATSIVSCICGLRIPTTLNMFQIKENVENVIEVHNRTCDKKVKFSVINEGNEMHVYLCCAMCCNLSVLF